MVILVLAVAFAMVTFTVIGGIYAVCMMINDYPEIFGKKEHKEDDDDAR